MSDAPKATGGHVDPDGPGLPALIEQVTGCRPTSVTITEPEDTMPETTDCHRCLGCGQLADSDDQEPWAMWADLPPRSRLAVDAGLVKPVTCPECGGTGKATEAVKPCTCQIDDDGKVITHHPRCQQHGEKAERATDPQPAGQAPVTGYTKQPPEAVQLVNFVKGYEGAIGDLLAHVQDDDVPTDPRMIALARTNLQQGFMWLVRSIFQPESRL